MANGFQTSSPAARHGDSVTPALSDNWCFAQKFTCPGSGTQEGLAIGTYGQDNALPLRLSVWTDDAVNNCPESMVANSESAELTFAAAVGKVEHTYTGTKPQFTAGTDYWIASFHGSAAQNLDYLAAGTPDAALTQRGSASYPTWPTGTQWETHTDDSSDVAHYVVYQALAAGWSAGNLNGVANASIAKVNGILVANISKINGV